MGGGGGGDVVGPAASTDNAIARFDGITGKLLQNGVLLEGDSGILSWSAGGEAITAGSYQIGRDADATNQLHFNVPTGAGMEWSVNDVPKILLNSDGTLATGDSSLFTGDTQFQVQANLNAIPASNQYTAASFGLTLDFPADNIGSFDGLDFYVNVKDAHHYTGAVAGIQGFVAASGGAGQIIDQAYGMYGIIESAADGNVITNAAGVTGLVVMGAVSTMTSAAALYAAPVINTGGTITTAYGAKIDAPGSGTTQWTLAAGSGNSYVAGKLSLGKSTAPTAQLDIAQAAASSGSPTALLVTGGAHTTLAASTEAISANFDFGQTVQFATGDIGLQRTVSFTPPTYSFVGASNIGAGVNNAVMGGPTVGTNGTMDVSIGQAIVSWDSNALSSYASLIQIPGIANGFGAANDISGLAIFDSDTVSLGNQSATLVSLSSLHLAQITYDSTTNVRTVSQGATLLIDGPMVVASANVAFTNGPYSQWTKAGTTRLDGQILVGQQTTFTPGAAFSLISATPTFAAENFNHTTLNLLPVQNGANTQIFKGANIQLTKATAATILASSIGLDIQTPNVTGTITSNRGILIEDQSGASITGSLAIDIQGSGSGNAIRLGASPLIYSAGANAIQFQDATDARGIAFTLSAAGNQAISVTGGNLEFINGAAFSAGGTVLSNYTESTFTPTVTLVGGAGNTVPQYTTNTGRYTQIGDRVFVDVYLTGDGGNEGAGTGQVNIALPVAAGASNPAGIITVGTALNNATSYALTGEITGGATTITLSYFNAINTEVSFTGADQNNATRTIRLQFFYEL